MPCVIFIWFCHKVGQMSMVKILKPCYGKLDGIRLLITIVFYGDEVPSWNPMTIAKPSFCGFAK